MLVLSPLEQQFFFATRSAKHGLVTMELFKALKLCSDGTLKVIVSRLLKKKALTKLKNGVYVWTVERGIDDVFYAATFVFNGYLAFSTALYLHKLNDQFPFTMFVATHEQSASRSIGEVEVKAVAIHKKAFGIQNLGDYVVSTIPKTIYDCFHLSEYAGGYSAILRAVYEAKMTKEQWLDFLNYVQKFEKPFYVSKISALLYLLGETDRPVPKWVLATLGKPSKVVLNKRELLHWWYV